MLEMNALRQNRSTLVILNFCAAGFAVLFCVQVCMFRIHKDDAESLLQAHERVSQVKAEQFSLDMLTLKSEFEALSAADISITWSGSKTVISGTVQDYRLLIAYVKKKRSLYLKSLVSENGKYTFSVRKL